MRKAAALTLVLAVPMVVAIFYTGPVAFAAPQGEGAGINGKALFLAQKCSTCHTVKAAGIERTTKSEKMAGPDLDGKVAERGAEWTAKYLRKQADIEGKKHGKEFKGTDEELAALVNWLAAQK